jgi:hypothetical protein
MKHVSQICQPQKVSAGQIDAFSPRFIAQKGQQNLSLSCTRWKVGRKVNIKVSVTNASD